MMPVMKKSLMFLMLLMSMTVCIDSCVPAVDMDNPVAQCELRFVLTSPAGPARSSMAVSDDVVNDMMLLVYQAGNLVSEKYYTTFSSMSVGLEPGSDYKFYALANVGRLIPPVVESGLLDWACKVSCPMSAFPMCWSSEVVVEGDEDMLVPISLTRLTARINLHVDCQVPGLEVKAVSLRQVPEYVRPFALDGSRAFSEESVSGDYATEEDVALLNAGGVISFYMLENMQGVLLDGNEDPMKKVLDQMSEESRLCTYIEVSCSFLPGSDKEGDVVYKLYLGKDNVADFSVERNTSVDVSLTLTPSGLGVEDSWKIEADYLQHATKVTLDQNELKLVTGCTASLNARVFPDDSFDKSLNWESTDDSVAMVDQNGKVSAVGEGTCIIKVVSSDRDEMSDECKVVVSPLSPVRVELNVSELQVPIEGNFSFKYRVHYNDGTVTPFLYYGFASLKAGSPEGWIVSDYAIADISAYGLLMPQRAGAAEVIMTVGWWHGNEYHSCSASCGLTVTGAYVTGIRITAPAMFYAGSAGPVLIGMMSDGSESVLIADEWITSVGQVSFSESSGIKISDKDALVQGKTRCTFTAYYKGMTAEVDMLYGKWVKAIRCVRTSDAGPGQYRYRIALVYDDFSEEYVPFTYCAEVNEALGVVSGSASEKGVALDWTTGSIRFETLMKYHDYTGAAVVWSTKAG